MTSRDTSSTRSRASGVSDAIFGSRRSSSDRSTVSKCLRNDPVCQPDATFGAFFGVFNVDGTSNKAEFYFKDIKGKVVDRFTVMSQVETVTETAKK